MNPQPEYGDIPFHTQVALIDALEIYGVSRDENLVTCHVSRRSYTFPRPYHAFIKFLLYVNDEITQTWKKEKKEDKVYWISLRAYLNDLLQRTLTVLKEKQQPVALACWLHREFMLCRHDNTGRREYLRLMERSGIAPYSVDIFELDWLTWWETQTKNGYYKFLHFKKFEKLFKDDWKVIKATSSNQLWAGMVTEAEEAEEVTEEAEEVTEEAEEENLGLRGLEDDLRHQCSKYRHPHATTEIQHKSIFAFKCLFHAPPDPPCMEDGVLDWDKILACLSSLVEMLATPEPDVPQFLHKFDQVRFLEKETVDGFTDLLNFLQEMCEEIHIAFKACHADLVKYLEKKLSLDKNEARRDIEMISSWLQQFKA